MQMCFELLPDLPRPVIREGIILAYDRDAGCFPRSSLGSKDFGSKGMPGWTSIYDTPLIP